MVIYLFRLFLLLFCGVVFSPVSVLSFPYQPSGEILIMSESLVDFSETPHSEGVIWRVVPQVNDADGMSELLFFKDGSDIQICRLVLSSSGAILESEITGVNRNMIIHDNDLLMVPGFPVPCDILPFQRMTGEQAPVSKIVNVKRSTANQTFVDTLEIKIYPIAFKEAQAKGWVIDTQNAELTGLLQVIEVINQQSGELLSLQLWNPDGDWWIFEKTSFRQSWRLLK
jgi:hypothetical protein